MNNKFVLKNYDNIFFDYVSDLQKNGFDLNRRKAKHNGKNKDAFGKSKYSKITKW